MITIRRDNFVPYQDLQNPSHHVVFYPELYTGEIINCISKNLTELKVRCLTVGLAHLTGKIFRSKSEKNPPGPSSCILLSNTKFTIRNRKTQDRITIKGQKGSVIIFGGMFRETWSYRPPKNSINLYEENPLCYIYLSTEHRFKYYNKIKNSLRDIKKLPIWKQCVQEYLNLSNMIGKGSYGNVYQTDIERMRFAIKLSKLKPEALDLPYSREVTSWYEFHFLNEIIKPLIQKNICPNLPLLYDSFVCDKCKLTIDDEHITTPCITTAVELASGDLKHFLRDTNPSPEEIYSALFQIMSALHAIQLHGQIMNFDVKKENVLYYNVEPGGYWHYKIHGKDFYVPNYGKIFILNDFGISRSMSPKFPLYKSKKDITFRLGSRYAVVMNGEFVPLSGQLQPSPKGEMVDTPEIKWSNKTTSKGVQFRMFRSNNKVIPVDITMKKKIKKFLKSNNIPVNCSVQNFFMHPEIIPPFEFYNDTQDAIRMFIGGKRTTQRGHHRLYSNVVTKEMISRLQLFNGSGINMNDHYFSTDPAQVLAGYFIENFFADYSHPPNTTKLGTYIMS